MRTRDLGAVLLLLAFAGCERQQEGAGNGTAEAPTTGYEERIAAMPEGQRNAVFIRAIRDAGLACQHVASSAPAGGYRGMPAWSARCDDGGEWTILLGSNGIAQIFNPAEAELIGGGNAAAPAARDPQP